MKIIYLFVIIISLTLLSCEKNETENFDLNLSTPIILSVSTSQSNINLDYDTSGTVVQLNNLTYEINVSVSISALKNNSIIPANSFLYLYKPGASNAFAKYSIKLEKVNLDTIIYSGNIKFKVQRADVGLFRLGCFIQLTDGRKSNEIQKSIQISRRNSKPIITSIIMPDSLTLGQIPSPDSSFLLQAAVSDSDGINDIELVYFYSRKPDGSIGNCGYPAQLYDDGSLETIFPPNYRSGDLVAGDGLFSLRIALRTRFKNNCPPPDTIETQRGNYTFTFFAIDKSNAMSDSVLKVWKVK